VGRESAGLKEFTIGFQQWSTPFPWTTATGLTTPLSHDGLSKIGDIDSIRTHGGQETSPSKNGPTFWMWCVQTFRPWFESVVQDRDGAMRSLASQLVRNGCRVRAWIAYEKLLVREGIRLGGSLTNPFQKRSDGTIRWRFSISIKITTVGLQKFLSPFPPEKADKSALGSETGGDQS
jgi:hypothetical protein